MTFSRGLNRGSMRRLPCPITKAMRIFSGAPGKYDPILSGSSLYASMRALEWKPLIPIPRPLKIILLEASNARSALSENMKSTCFPSQSTGLGSKTSLLSRHFSSSPTTGRSEACFFRTSKASSMYLSRTSPWSVAAHTWPFPSGSAPMAE